MDFFNKIGDIANKTYKKTSQKTGEIAKEAKLKMKMNDNKSKINNLYEEIGKIVYQKYLNNEEVKINEDLNTYLNQIDELSKEIETYQEDILKIKNKRICENCYSEINLDAKYCPHCGFEQKEEKVEDIKENETSDEGTKEIEIIEDNDDENNKKSN